MGEQPVSRDEFHHWAATFEGTVVREFRETKDAIEATAALQRITNGRLLKAEAAIQEIQTLHRVEADGERRADADRAGRKTVLLSGLMTALLALASWVAQHLWKGKP